MNGLIPRQHYLFSSLDWRVGIVLAPTGKLKRSSNTRFAEEGREVKHGGRAFSEERDCRHMLIIRIQGNSAFFRTILNLQVWNRNW